MDFPLIVKIAYDQDIKSMNLSNESNKKLNTTPNSILEKFKTSMSRSSKYQGNRIMGYDLTVLFPHYIT